MVDGKRKTGMFKIGEPTADEKRKMMKKVVCVWVILTDDRVRTTCEKEAFFCREDIWCWFNYCPICGKKIKVKP
jgi:hypothetical protein